MTRCLRFLSTVDFRRIAWVAVLLGACGGTAYWVATDYVGAAVFQIVGWSLIISRNTAMMMLPVFSLCLLAVCCRTMTVLRATPLNYIIPFDDAINFHQWMGGIGVFLAILHSVCHIVNFISAKNEVHYSELYFKAPGAAAGLVWNPCITATGCLMLLGMAVALPFAFKWPKRASWLRETALGKVLNDFNMFYITHQIFFLMFVTLFLIHPVPGHSHVRGKRTYLPVPYSWMWMACPLALYIGERIYGLFRAHYWDTQVMGASILDSGVLTLELTKPHNFCYIPGQYVLIQCGDISAYEWHPFSLTSAPDDNFLQVHINNAGDWTGALHARFCALMHLTHNIKEDLLERVSQSLKEQSIIRKDEQCPEQRLPTTATSNKQIADDGREEPETTQRSTSYERASFKHLVSTVEASERVVQQRGSFDGSTQLNQPVPAKSYISYVRSSDYGSQLQRMQARRMKDSEEAWESMPGPDKARRYMQRMSSDKLRRLESALQRSSSLTAPSQAPRLRIDGPFGSPAQEHTKFRKVLLIGMGTGIAPMLSIMRDTLHRLAALPSDSPGLQADDGAKRVEQRKAYMHWVVRDPRAAVWLKYEFEIMSLLDVTGSVFTSHVHVTGEQVAEVPLPKLLGSDPQLNSTVKLTPGRPDFEGILEEIQGEAGRARVGVFLCGPRSARNTIRKLCAHATTAGETTFIFHAEHF